MDNGATQSIDDRYEVLHALAACSVAHLDRDLRILDFNRQAEVTFGLRGEDVIGRRFHELAHLARHGDALVQDLERALGGHTLSWIECDLVAADGHERVLLWNAQPVRQDGAIIGLMLVAQDLTDRRRAERRAQTLELESERKRRLAEVGAIVARVTHDLNNPLTAATLLVSMLQEAANRRPTTPIGTFQSQLADLDAALIDLKDLIDSCHHFLRDQRLELTELSVADLLRDVLRTWSVEAAQRDVVLRTQLSPGTPRVHADVGKLRRVLDNLVRNAIEAIEHGPGSVAITVESAGASGLSLVVEDTGPGLPEGVDVFAAFATTKPHGTGLGLAIARQFVEAHGGSIVAEPAFPHGTRFRIVVPCRPPGLVARQLAAPMPA